MPKPTKTMAPNFARSYRYRFLLVVAQSPTGWSSCDLFRLLLGEHLLVELKLLALQDVAIATAGLKHTGTRNNDTKERV